jgi:hypothetical protein
LLRTIRRYFRRQKVWLIVISFIGIVRKVTINHDQYNRSNNQIIICNMVNLDPFSLTLMSNTSAIVGDLFFTELR